MITYEPIWISTDEHLKKLFAIFNQTSTLEKMFGTYNLPPNYPHIHMFWGVLPFNRVPVVATATGIGKIDETKFSFQSKPFNPFGSITKNLVDLEFILEADDIIQVTHAKIESPIIQYYSIPFTRVLTKKEGLLNNFLICVGGSGPSMENIITQSKTLFQNLEKLLVNKV